MTLPETKSKTFTEIMESKVSLNANLKLDDWLFSPKEVRQIVKEFLAQELAYYESTNNHTCDNWERIYALRKLLKAVEH